MLVLCLLCEAFGTLFKKFIIIIHIFSYLYIYILITYILTFYLYVVSI